MPRSPLVKVVLGLVLAGTAYLVSPGKGKPIDPGDPLNRLLCHDPLESLAPTEAIADPELALGALELLAMLPDGQGRADLLATMEASQEYREIAGDIRAWMPTCRVSGQATVGEYWFEEAEHLCRTEDFWIGVNASEGEETGYRCLGRLQLAGQPLVITWIEGGGQSTSFNRHLNPGTVPQLEACLLEPPKFHIREHLQALDRYLQSVGVSRLNRLAVLRARLDDHMERGPLGALHSWLEAPAPGYRPRDWRVRDAGVSFSLSSRELERMGAVLAKLKELNEFHELARFNAKSGEWTWQLEPVRRAGYLVGGAFMKALAAFACVLVFAVTLAKRRPILGNPGGGSGLRWLPMLPLLLCAVPFLSFRNRDPMTLPWVNEAVVYLCLGMLLLLANVSATWRGARPPDRERRRSLAVIVPLLVLLFAFVMYAVWALKASGTGEPSDAWQEEVGIENWLGFTPTWVAAAGGMLMTIAVAGRSARVGQRVAGWTGLALVFAVVVGTAILDVTTQAGQSRWLWHPLMATYALLVWIPAQWLMQWIGARFKGDRIGIDPRWLLGALAAPFLGFAFFARTAYQRIELEPLFTLMVLPAGAMVFSSALRASLAEPGDADSALRVRSAAWLQTSADVVLTFSVMAVFVAKHERALAELALGQFAAQLGR